MEYREIGMTKMRIIILILAFAAAVVTLTACTADPAPVADTSDTVTVAQTPTLAPAPNPDAIFIGALDNADIPYTTTETAIAVGHKLCEQLQENPTWMVFAAVQEKYPHLNGEQHLSLLTAAETAYCP